MSYNRMAVFKPESIKVLADRVEQGIWVVVTPNDAKLIANLDHGIYDVHVSVADGMYKQDSLTYAVHTKVWDLYITAMRTGLRRAD